MYILCACAYIWVYIYVCVCNRYVIYYFTVLIFLHEFIRWKDKSLQMTNDTLDCDVVPRNSSSCEFNHPCQYGICINTEGTISCACDPGWTGIV